MKKRKNPSSPSTPETAEAANLRKRAEAQAARQEANEALPQSEAELRRMVHEMQVHQIELEMQNEELRQARTDVESGLESYTELYDFAPVGYFTLARSGTIRRANLTGTKLLGEERSRILGKRLGLFVAENDRLIFNSCILNAFTSLSNQTCEVSIVREGGEPFWVQIEATASIDGKECHVMALNIDDRKQAEIKFQHLSMHDALTGLYNRSFFEDAIQRLENGRHYPISVVYADVDHLKVVNDRDGHAAGDALLKRAAHVLTLAFRSEDVIARIGGDEFAVLLPNTSAVVAEDAIRRFTDILLEHNAALPKEPLKITFGLSTAVSGTPLIEAIKEADANMYFAKQRRKISPVVKEKSRKSFKAGELRKQAEALDTQNQTHSQLPPSEIDSQRAVHELRVHQIELEMQNEELRRAQAEVEAGLERYTELYDFAPVGYFTLGKNSLIQQVNLNGARLLGVDRAHLAGRRFGAFVDEEDLPVFNDFIKKICSSPVKQTCQVSLLARGRKPRWVQIEGAAIVNRQECRIVVSDISDRKRIDDTLLFLAQRGWLAFGEDFFDALARFLAETMEMEYVCIERLINDFQAVETVVVYRDGQFEENQIHFLKDTPCGKVVGEVFGCFPKDVRHLFPQDALLEELVAESYVGATLWSSVGQPIGLIAAIGRQPLENTQLAESILKLVAVRAAGELERRQAEKALQESEEKYRVLVENQRDLIVKTDVAGNYLFVNQVYCNLFGKTEKELLGKDYMPLVHPDDLSVVTQAVEELFKPPFECTYEERALTKQGWRWLSWNAKAVLDEDGHVIALLGTGLDIHELKQAEDGLKKYAMRQEKIAALGRALSATLDFEQIYQTAERYIKSMIDCPNFGITLFDPKKAILTAAYFSTDGKTIDVNHLPTLSYNPQHSSSGRSKAIDSQTPEITNDLAAQRIASGGMLVGSDQELQSAMYVPMIVEGEVIGLLDLQSYQEKAYSNEDGEWLSVVANQIGMAIQNARLFASSQQRIAELTAIHAIDSAISAHLDPEETNQVLLEQMVTRLEVDAVDILLLNPQTQLLNYVAGRGFRSHLIEESSLRLGAGLAGRAALEKRMVQMSSLAGDDVQFLRQEIWAEEGFEAYFGVPLLAGSKLIGVLEVFQRSPLSPDDDWLRFLELLAGQAAIVIETTRLTAEVRSANEDLLNAYDATIEGWSQAMDMRDKETEGHTLRVTELTLQFACELDLGDETHVHIRRGALLHDIGKLGVPDAILHKADSLTDDEWVVMRNHPVFAYQMLSAVEYLRPALDIPYCHHERWDGSGYPRGLKGEQIPLAARMFAIVDVWDALTSDRPYRPAWTEASATQYLHDQSGIHFDPQLVQIFLDMIEKNIL